MLVAIIFWSGAFIAAKFSVKEFPPFTLTFLRFFIATIVIFLIIPRFEKNWKIKSKDIPQFLFLGATGMFGYHLLFFMAVKKTTVIHSSLIGTMNPLFTTILAMIFLKDKITLKKTGAILLSFIGVMLTITEGNLSLLTSSGIQIGDLYMICAVLCWAIYSIYSKKVSLHFPPIVITAYSFLFCVILLIPFVLWEKPWFLLYNSTIKGWTAIFYMALLPSVVGFLIQQVAIRKIGPRRTSMFGFLVPLVSIFLSILILKEQFQPFLLFSSSLIITGVYFATQN
jgi:drug/metabolite transporter (DMT)-like permease